MPLFERLDQVHSQSFLVVCDGKTALLLQTTIQLCRLALLLRAVSILFIYDKIKFIVTTMSIK